MMGIIENIINTDAMIKIIIAVGLSLIMGVEREMKKKPIGFKTTTIIATFSCLLTIISIEAAYLVPARNDINVTMDPLRLAAQIVSGVGFLGAGAILRKDNDSITGLTTAALIWGAAGIGIAVGAGFYFEAAFTVISVMLVIKVFAPLLGKLGPNRVRQKEAAMNISLTDSDKINNLLQYLEDEKIMINNLRIRKSYSNGTSKHKLYLRVGTTTKKTTEQIYLELIKLPYIYTAEINFLE